MDAQTALIDLIRHSSSPLLGPLPLEHSQELAEGLPPIRRHVGPRAWYQALESPSPETQRRKPN